MSRNRLSLAVLASLPFLVALRPRAEEYDLSLRFAVGQRFELRERFAMELNLEELEVAIDGTPIADDGAVSFEVGASGDVLMTEEILELREGAPSRLRFDVTTLAGTFDMDMDAMGESESMSEPVFPDFEGRTLEVAIDEDGTETVIDRTDFASATDLEPLDDGELQSFTHSEHFADLLPSSPLAVGATFDLAGDWKELIDVALAELDTGGVDAELQGMLEGLSDILLEAATLEATGELAAVEGKSATLVYRMKLTLELDDLLERVKGLLPPGELEELPPGIEAELEASMEVTGKGTFDLELGQLTQLELDSTFSIRFSGAAKIEGTEASSEVVLAGTLQVEASITPL